MRAFVSLSACPPSVLLKTTIAFLIVQRAGGKTERIIVVWTKIWPSTSCPCTSHLYLTSLPSFHENKELENVISENTKLVLINRC